VLGRVTADIRGNLKLLGRLAADSRGDLMWKITPHEKVVAI
jgi:hypothetical protein